MATTIIQRVQLPARLGGGLYVPADGEHDPIVLLDEKLTPQQEVKILEEFALTRTSAYACAYGELTDRGISA